MLGKASIKIEWNEDGAMNVYHGTDKVLLASKELTDEDEHDWDKLWEFMRNELNLK